MYDSSHFVNRRHAAQIRLQVSAHRSELKLQTTPAGPTATEAIVHSKEQLLNLLAVDVDQ